jgi:hypothetical protein
LESDQDLFDKQVATGVHSKKQAYGESPVQGRLHRIHHSLVVRINNDHDRERQYLPKYLQSLGDGGHIA